MLNNSAGFPTTSTYKLLICLIQCIWENVTEKLWQILDLRSDKEKIVKFCSGIQEASHAMKDEIQLHSKTNLI